MDTKRNENKGAFYRRAFALVLPMALQNLINVGVNAADVIMLGRVGETSLSASSLAGQIYFILVLILFGITSGAGVLTSQYWGKRDMDSIAHILSIALRFALLPSILFMLAAWMFPNLLMGVFTSEADVIREGSAYLRIVSFSYVFIGISITCLNALRSMERVVISTVVYSISLVVNVTLNYLLIFGSFGFPKLGIQGAAIATLFARMVELLVVFVYVRRNPSVLSFHIRHLFEWNRLLLRDFIKYVSPVIVNELFWGVGISMTAAVLGHLGKSVVAANSVTQVAKQLAMVISFGIANATAIVVGKAIGEGNEAKAKTYSLRFVWLSLAFGLFGSAIVLIARPVSLHLLNLTPTAQSYLSIMMFIMAYYVVCQSFNATMIVGNFRAGGDTKIGLILDVSSMWLSTLPLGALAAFVLHLPIPLVYFILTADELLKVIPSAVHYLRHKWLNNVTR